MLRDNKCSWQQASHALHSVIATLNSDASSSEVRMRPSQESGLDSTHIAPSHEGSTAPTEVPILNSSAAMSNLPYFSLDTSCKSHRDEEVIHDVDNWLRLINRVLVNHSDRTKCSVALNKALDTAKHLIDELIDVHDSNWSKISTEYIVQCRQPQDCKQLQIEILSLKRNHNESLQDLYLRAVRLRTKLLRVKPHHKQWVQEELKESFARAVSMKFFYKQERRW